MLMVMVILVHLLTHEAWLALCLEQGGGGTSCKLVPLACLAHYAAVLDGRAAATRSAIRFRRRWRASRPPVCLGEPGPGTCPHGSFRKLSTWLAQFGPSRLEGARYIVLWCPSCPLWAGSSWPQKDSGRCTRSKRNKRRGAPIWGLIWGIIAAPVTVALLGPPRWSAIRLPKSPWAVSPPL